MKVAKLPLQLNRIKDDPFGFFIDKIIAFIVNLLIPLPLAGDLVAQFKKPIACLLITLLIFFLFMLTVIGTIFMSPVILGSNILTNITSVSDSNNSNIPSDSSFGDTQVPRKNPFGGTGMSYTTVTSYFLDPGYYLQFGKQHPAIDLVPSLAYYENSQTYKETHKVAIFATISGSVIHYIDGYGGETVEITNTDNTFKVKYIHFSFVLVDNGNIVRSGTPIGIMGDTGFSTGDHVHYEIRIKDGNTWRAVNPLSYIQ
jgi:murein DD-endopeptidase MepM/ murein hydrolase activator NlpD